MNTLYDLLTVLPFSLLTLMLFGGFAGIPKNSLPAACISVTVSVFCILLRNMKRKTRLCSIGVAAVFLAGLTYAVGEEYRQIFFTEYFWVLHICGFAAAALIAGMLMNRYVWAGRIVTAALTAYCIAGAVRGTNIGKAAFALLCLMLLIRTAEEVQRKWNKSGCPDRKEHITRISPFFLAGCLLVYAAPAPKQPYDWQFVKNIYHYTVTLATRIYGSLTHPSDDYAKAGFSDDGGFVSGLSENSEEVLFIQPGNTSVRNFELVGCISGEFTGREWIFDTETENRFRLFDTMETVSAVRQYAPEHRYDYLQKLDMRYENRFYNTQYIFAPAKIKLEATRERMPGISERNGSIFSKKKLQFEDRYQVACYVLNYDNPHLPELLTDAEPVKAAEWKQTALTEGVLYKPGYTFADYQQYRSSVRETYCRSYGVSEQVRAILDELKNNSSSDYEALKNLEAFLSSMEYSTNCGALPDSVTDAGSFLDYFLFRSQRGFCMHFATAFTLMSQEMGFPCRYVQGYNAPKDSSGSVTVRQSNAHAWPEVYFEHVGWVAFEPTPGYSVQTGWTVREGSLAAFEYQPTIPDIARVPAEPVDNLPGTPEKRTAINPLVFIIPSASVICFLLLFFLISKVAALRKYAQMRSDEKFRYLAQQNLRLIGRLGIRMAEDETLAEFRSRVLASDRQDIQEQLGFIPLYEAVLYSDRAVTEDEISAAEQTRQTLRALVKKNRLRHVMKRITAR